MSNKALTALGGVLLFGGVCFGANQFDADNIGTGWVGVVVAGVGLVLVLVFMDNPDIARTGKPPSRPQLREDWNIPEEELLVYERLNAEATQFRGVGT